MFICMWFFPMNILKYTHMNVNLSRVTMFVNCIEITSLGLGTTKETRVLSTVFKHVRAYWTNTS